jgi:hypothetical protein
VPTFSIITPTCGRLGIFEMAADMLSKLGPRDEWLIVCDGPQPEVVAFFRTLLDPRVLVQETPATGFFGNAQRDVGLSLVTKSHTIFADDDDTLLNLELARRLVAANPDVPNFFRLEGAGGAVIIPGPGKELAGGAGTIFPNVTGRVPLWGGRVSGEFNADLVQRFGGAVFHPDIQLCEMRTWSRCRPGEQE